MTFEYHVTFQFVCSPSPTPNRRELFLMGGVGFPGWGRPGVGLGVHRGQWRGALGNGLCRGTEALPFLTVTNPLCPGVATASATVVFPP